MGCDHDGGGGGVFVRGMGMGCDHDGEGVWSQASTVLEANVILHVLRL